VTQALIILAFLAGYALFTLARPDRACPRCGGWGQRTRRRGTSACARCQGTGRAFLPGARLVHRAAAAGIRYVRERMESGR
jgi:DnaJ-class molecular chaperone